MNYKGYTATVKFSEKDKMFWGKIDFINDTITFEADSVQKLEEEFHNSVDEYLDFCKKVGKAPEKTFKGSFNIRISPELHKKLSLIAIKKSKSLNKLIEESLNLEVYANN